VSEHSHDENGVRYEGSDANPGGIVRIGLIVTAVVLATVFVLGPLMSLLGAREAGLDPPAPPMAAEENRRAPEPRLQERPFEDVAKLRAADRPFLEEYGWVDEKAGTVHIPIDEAMKIVARRGLPARPQPASPSPQEERAPAAPVGGHP
jgi:hypothetical protein